jgi:hypothetical protein
MFNQLATKLDKGIGLLTKIFSTLGSVFLVLMMLILVIIKNFTTKNEQA